MRITTNSVDSTGKISGYTLKLSAQETYDWAHSSNSSWPCSDLSDNNLCIVVDSNGLCDILVGGIEGSAAELEACVADHLPQKYRHLWPVWSEYEKEIQKLG